MCSDTKLPATLWQFKTYILCLLEYSNAEIYHASSSHLELLDSLQTQFLRNIGLRIELAFLRYHMAPWKLRRDIGAFGLLHKIKLGGVHPDFGNLLAQKVCCFIPNTRHGSRRHGRQFEVVSGNSFYFNNSLFGTARIYNVLPEHIVSANNVSVL